MPANVTTQARIGTLACEESTIRGFSQTSTDRDERPNQRGAISRRAMTINGNPAPDNRVSRGMRTRPGTGKVMEFQDAKAGQGSPASTSSIGVRGVSALNKERGTRASAWAWSGCLLAIGMIAAGPTRNEPEPARPHVLSNSEKERLRTYARDTWKTFEALTEGRELPSDGLCREEDGRITLTEHTSPTNVAMYIWSIIAAEELGLIAPYKAHRRLDRIIATLEKMTRPHGFFLNQLDPRTSEPLKIWPGSNEPSRPFLSTVDNGWLATALIMVRNTRSEFRDRADALLRPMDFGFFYNSPNKSRIDPHAGLLYGGYWTDTQSYGWAYGMVNSEPRIVSYIAIARGQVPPEHYYRMRRTRQPTQTEQKQVPDGETRVYLEVPVFEGHYHYRGLRIVPSWGGSMFEALMVPLVVPEARWAPRSWAINHPLYIEAQIIHGLEEARYGYWGFSPACKPEGGYESYGVPAIGAMIDGYGSNDDNTRYDPMNPPPPGAYKNGVVTPHAVFLALPFAPSESIQNLDKLLADFPIYGPFGFQDSVNVTTGVVSRCVLALDQGMILASIANVLADNVMQRAFSEGMIEEAIRPLIAPEEFTAGRGPDRDR